MSEEIWGIVSLMGHKRVAGKISEMNLGGPLLRVDVPEVNGNPSFTMLYGNNAIFEISVVDEAIATATAMTLGVLPVMYYEMEHAIAKAVADRLKGEDRDDDSDCDTPC